MINEKSLENLKKPKEKRKYGFRYALPQDKIDSLFKLLTDGRSLKDASREINICYDTAKKYFEKGDERRGIKPLKFRLQIFQDSVSKEFDVQLIERRKHLLDVITRSITQMEEAIDANVLTKKGSYAQLCNLIRTEIWLRGGEVSKHEERLFTAEDIRDLSKGSNT